MSPDHLRRLAAARPSPGYVHALRNALRDAADEIDRLNAAIETGDGTIVTLGKNGSEAYTEIKRLTTGLLNLSTQDYDNGYTPEAYADAVLSGHEPDSGSEPDKIGTQADGTDTQPA